MDETERFLIPREVQPRIPFLTSHVFAFTGSPNAFARIAPLRMGRDATRRAAKCQSAHPPSKAPLAIEECNPILTLHLPPALAREQESDATRRSACKHFQNENPEYAPRKGCVQTFSVRYNHLREYVFDSQRDSKSMPAELRYMRLFLLLLIGPPDMLANYNEHGTFRSKTDLWPKAVKAFGEVVQYNHYKERPSEEEARTAIAALHSLCFTKLGRPRTNFAWLRWRDRIAPNASLLAMIISLFVMTLAKWFLNL